MLIDSRTLPNNTTIEADVVIIGGGAAGITLAREFAHQPIEICLLESGGLEMDQATQSLYEGESVGVPYYPLQMARLRYFGGSTNHWGGTCWPLEDIDFRKRSWVPYSGWPFNREHLLPYYQRAQSICGLGPFDYQVDTWELSEHPRLRFEGGHVRSRIAQISNIPSEGQGTGVNSPYRFGRIYQDEIKASRNIRTYLHANVVDIQAAENARSVKRLEVACLNGNRFYASGKIFILATGGIENARMLLLSNKVQSNGLGNQHDLVGRFFMDHPNIRSGELAFSDPYTCTHFYDLGTVRSIKVHGHLTLSPEIQEREGLLNYCCALRPERDDIASNKGVASLRHLIKSLRRLDVPEDLWSHLRNVVSDFDDVGEAIYRHVTAGEVTRTYKVVFHHHPEQAPNPDSRVTLSQERDALGKNKIQLDWRLSSQDRCTMRRAQEIMALEAGRAGLGRVKISMDETDDAWTVPKVFSADDFPVGSYHHMGTTRMHVDPKQGVVDENCRIHGMANLFVAGSSVFPTVGYANPTLTIVALSLRLADHIQEGLS